MDKEKRKNKIKFELERIDFQAHQIISEIA